MTSDVGLIQLTIKESEQTYIISSPLELLYENAELYAQEIEIKI